MAYPSVEAGPASLKAAASKTADRTRWLTLREEGLKRLKGNAQETTALALISELDYKACQDAGDERLDLDYRHFYAEAYLRYFGLRCFEGRPSPGRNDYRQALQDMELVIEARLQKGMTLSEIRELREKKREMSQFLAKASEKAQSQPEEIIDASPGPDPQISLAGRSVEDTESQGTGLETISEAAPEVLPMGPSPQALELAGRAALQLTMSDPAAETRYRQALIAYQKKNFDKACGILREILNRDPKNERCKKSLRRIEVDPGCSEAQ
jgi:tetratricopeptide (TPR) repeat protein